MKHTQYTPGPWRHHKGNHGEYLVSCELGGYAPLARVRGDKRSTPKSAHANAQLIAAAPELLDSLFAMARATIAKATGAQP